MNAPTNVELLHQQTSHVVAPTECVEAEMRELEMRELSISRVGAHYWYEGYEYDHLADAVAYARTHRGRGDVRSTRMPPPLVSPPSESDQQLMQDLSITSEHGAFFFAGYRYEHLADAVGYARLRVEVGERREMLKL